jgi:FkbM family methyltransferase
MEDFYLIKRIDDSDLELSYNDVTKRILDEFASPESKYLPFISSSKYIFDQLFDGLSENLTVLDIGSNGGLFSLYCSPKCKTVHAIEPSSVLCRTIKEFSKEVDNVKIHNCAISTQDGSTNFYFFPEATGQSTIHNRAPAGNTKIQLVVRTFTLPSFLEANNIDFLDVCKMDIEGEEVNIFTDELIEQLKDKVGRYWVECHHTAHINGKSMQQNYAELTQKFKFHGYNLHEDIEHFGFIAYR